MNILDVPQEGNATLAGARKAVYARDNQGQVVMVASKGWEVEEIVTLQAVEVLKELADAALARVKAGDSSPLEYWMYVQRMDLPILSQSVDMWQWRVSRHLKPAPFAKLSPKTLARYADALGLPAEQLQTIPL